MPLPLLAGLAGAYLGYRRDRAVARAAEAQAATAAEVPVSASPGPMPAPREGDGKVADRMRWDPNAKRWVPYKSRRRRRTGMTKGQLETFAFLRSQGVAADKAAGLVLSGVAR